MLGSRGIRTGAALSEFESAWGGRKAKTASRGLRNFSIRKNICRSNPSLSAIVFQSHINYNKLILMSADENTSWDYKPDGQKKSQMPQLSSRGVPVTSQKKKAAVNETAEWTASEYIDHTRGAFWYVLLTVGTAALTAAIYFLTKDIFAGVITAVVGIIVGIFSMQKPKETTYRLSGDGLSIGEKFYPYSRFRSFAIIHEGGLTSINLVPVKKFMPIISAYFEPTQEEKIVNILGQHLAYEERGLDSIERLTRRLRF